jgi:transposase-like protein
MPKTLARSSSTYLTRRRWRPEDAKDALDAQAQSGLSPSAFAIREGLDVQRLFRWRRRLGADAPEAQRFEEVIARDAISPLVGGGTTAPVERDRFEIVLRSGLVVRFAESFNADALLRLLNTIGEVRSC